MAWRNAGKEKTETETPQKEADKPKKGVRFVEDQNGLPTAQFKLTVGKKQDPKKCTEEIHSLQQAPNKTSFFANLVTADWTVDCVPFSTDCAIGTESANGQPVSSGPKVPCFECYKLFAETQAVKCTLI